MADPNVQACLEKLSAILGTSIVLGDATDPVSEDEEVKAISSYRKVTTPDDKKPEEQQGAPTPAEAAAEAEKEDAPVKFQLHDVGPRPRTDGAFDLEHFQPNEPTGEDMEFCPWKVVVDYPDHFVGNRNRPHVCLATDDRNVEELKTNEPAGQTIVRKHIRRQNLGLVRTRSDACVGNPADLEHSFYIFDPTTVKDKPYFLVPTSQFQIFLDKVNKDLGVALSIPAGVNADRFLMKFGQDGTPRPRYIGRSEKDKPFNIEDWPSPGTEDAEAYQAASAIVQQDFLDKMKKMKLPPAKDRGAKAKTKAARKRADREHMLAEVQYLLGLKGWEGVTEMVFVSVDIEALERAPNLISEVGIAVLDAKDMRQVSPGDCGKDWWPLVKCYHFRTHEYSGLVNREYVQGCPDAFDFGYVFDDSSHHVQSVLI